MLYQNELSVEQQVAINMGDDDAFDPWCDAFIPDNGCSRAKSFEVEQPIRTEAEPQTLKYNKYFVDM